jgi:hypothetical protein
VIYIIISLSRNNPTLLVIEQLFLFVSLLAPVHLTSRIKVLDGTGTKEIITLFLESLLILNTDRRLMSNDRDVRLIIQQLQDLQLQQAALVTRLGQLSESDNAAATSTETNRVFVLGDRVRVLNPRRLQAKTGTIIKIGTNRITIRTTRGSTVVRAPKNLVLENE